MKISLFLFFSILLISPASAFAVPLAGFPFGGLVSVPLYCTCSQNWRVTYSIAYPLLSPFATSRSLIYQPGETVAYGFQQFVTTPTPATWELGTYAPGAAQCLITAPNPDDPCLILPASGTILTEGASFPGAM